MTKQLLETEREVTATVDWAASCRFRDYRFRATIYAAQFASARLDLRYRQGGAR